MNNLKFLSASVRRCFRKGVMEVTKEKRSAEEYVEKEEERRKNRKGNSEEEESGRKELEQELRKREEEMDERKFLKNTGQFQPCPLDVLKSFLKTQGGFRAARWMLFVAGRFRLSADSRFRFQLFTSTTLNHKLKPFSLQLAPQTLFYVFSFCGCFVVRIFSCLRTKNGF